MLAIAEATMDIAYRPQTPLIGQVCRALAYPVTLVAAGYLYVRKSNHKFGRPAIAVGLIWAIASLLLML